MSTKIQIGYKLSSEEFGPTDLVQYARMAEDRGFTFALISVVGQRWPSNLIRQEMLEEATVVMRLLWEGGLRSHRGRYFTVENARIYTRAPEPPPIMIAAGGQNAARLAGRLGDGLIGTEPDRGLRQVFERAGGQGKPRFGELTVCWATDERQARRTAKAVWPTAATPSELAWELPLPSQFEAAAELVSEDAIAESVVCGPEVERHVAAIKACAPAGFDHVCVHQVGPDQEGFLRVYEREVMPRLADVRAAT